MWMKLDSDLGFECFFTCRLLWLVDLHRVRWRPHLVSGTTTMSLRRWSQKFARQPSVTASTFLSIPARHHPHPGKTTRQHLQKAWKPMRHHLQNISTQSRHHPQNTVSRIRHHQKNTGKQTWHLSQNTGEPTVFQHNFKRIHHKSHDNGTNCVWNSL